MSNREEQFPITVMFTSRDPKKSIAFYRDVLGFTLKECWPDENNPMWANVVLDGQSIMIGALMSPEAASEMCGEDAGAVQYMKTLHDEFKANRNGVGIVTYIRVPDVDAYHATISAKGAKHPGKPKNQFYGQRDFGVEDADGYRLIFYTPIQMSSCQSCGMPLKDAAPGAMYCGYCTDDKGRLKSYAEVLEGTTSGYFMGMQKMPRAEAEKAAKSHLSKMPAWKGH